MKVRRKGLNSLSSRPVNFELIRSMMKKILKKSHYFRLPPNLARRKLIDLANHRPSFMPYKAVGVACDFFVSGSEMASCSRSTRERMFNTAEVVQQVLNDENNPEGMSSGEESDLDRRLYDSDGNLR